MNAKTALTSLVLAAGFAGSAFAEGPLPANEAFTSTRTRAEVQAELASFRQAGVNPLSITYNPLRSFRGTATREAVAAEYLGARAEVRALTGEDSGSHYLSRPQRPAADGKVAFGIAQ